MLRIRTVGEPQMREWMALEIEALSERYGFTLEPLRASSGEKLPDPGRPVARRRRTRSTARR